ncbi:hypothetical protein ACWOFR_10950 [Carnobacterium gallinarum]|uniref:hypothetical protein n=1 Tax=Carnobacterium gallinarum TaxID=2749 RepID=UPI0005590CFB|nr:hypothetical protein [Carnobacterium gallinarum]
MFKISNILKRKKVASELDYQYDFIKNLKKLEQLDGVKNNINMLKKQKMEEIPRYYSCTEEEYNKEKEIEEIPLQKIVGIVRFGTYNTWYDVYKSYKKYSKNLYRNNYSVDGKIRVYKLDKLIDHVVKGEISFNKILSKPDYQDYPRFIYIVELDKYFVSDDGSHRTFLAKLIPGSKLYGKIDKYTKDRTKI